MKKFKPKFMPLFLILIILGVPLGALMIFIDPDLTFELIPFLMSLPPLGLIVGSVVILLLNSYFSVEIDSRGICAVNTWGLKRKLKWDEITTCRPFSLLGIRYVRLYGGRLRWGIWIPEFLSNKQEFLNLLFEFVPSSNPFKKHYENS